MRGCISDTEVSDIEVSDAEISDPEVSDIEVADSQRDVGHAWMYMRRRTQRSRTLKGGINDLKWGMINDTPPPPRVLNGAPCP